MATVTIDTDAAAIDILKTVVCGMSGPKIEKIVLDNIWAVLEDEYELTPAAIAANAVAIAQRVAELLTEMIVLFQRAHDMYDEAVHG